MKLTSGIKFKDIEYNTLELYLESVLAKSKVRPIKVSWTPELASEIERFRNIDAEAELTALLSEEIAKEVDREILNQLKRNVNLSNGQLDLRYNVNTTDKDFYF